MNQKITDEQDPFDSFLSKVKEVSSIINDISSPDIEISTRGLDKAGKYLRNSEGAEKEDAAPDEDGLVTVYSRSSLNRRALKDDTESKSFSSKRQENFMTAAENDAKERMKRKRSCILKN